MMRFVRRLPALAAVVALASACGDSTGPDAQPSTLTALAYVDADGSGTLTPGDVPLAGATVSVTDDEGNQVAQAQTGQDGRAVFADVEPGVYTLTLAATPPAGAVLATSSSLTVTAPSLGGEVAAEFRYSFFPGTVTGVVFRDDNSSGAFEADADVVAPGVAVNLYAGAAAAGTPLATTTTDADGLFSFAGLRAGTYTLELVPLPGTEIVDGLTRQVTVTADAVADVPVRFTGSLRTDVAVARTLASGTPVLVEGVVTAPQGAFNSRSIYLQDRTGGLQVFGVDAAMGLVVGDSVRVSGTLGAFRGEVQIVSPTAEKIGTGTVPTPIDLSGAQILTLADEGELVRIDSLEVLSVIPTGSSHSVNVRSPDGSEFVVRGESGTGIDSLSWLVGDRYTVVGLLGSRDGVPQLKPRSPSDVAPTTPPLTIAQARAVAAGDTVTVVGVVTVPQGAFRTDNVYIQDATGGIQVFSIDTSLGLELGDQVRVMGVMGAFRTELQIVSLPGTSDPVVTVIGTAPVPGPRVITGAELAARTFEGELVRLNDVTITAAPATASGSYNVTGQAPDGTVVTLRVEGNSGIAPAAFTVGSTYDLVGVLSVFDGTPQLKPRSPADVIAS